MLETMEFEFEIALHLNSHLFKLTITTHHLFYNHSPDKFIKLLDIHRHLSHIVSNIIRCREIHDSESKGCVRAPWL